MAENKPRIYPIGIQSFEDVIKEGYVYVDKTQYIVQLLAAKSKYVFLSRPRRFGKSLLTSTLHCYFAGRRDLFAGLYIADVEKDWTQYPVLHFDLSICKSLDPADVERSIGHQLADYEDMYGRDPSEFKPNERLRGLIRRAYGQTGRGVVLLIDEYDAPMMEVLADEDALKAVRQVMRNFYSPTKACDPYLRFVFLTGITKFSQMSIFSELNNLRNISMLPQFAGICGITKEELLSEMSVDIEMLARKLNESPDETHKRLREHYDGYHFAKTSPDVFNPYSLLNAFNDKDIRSYWFGTATPKFLIDTMRKYSDGLSDIASNWVRESKFDVATERPSDILPLLYQTGYLTIKNYDADSDLYLLEMPNNEVREGMCESLIKSYIDNDRAVDRNVLAMRDCIRCDDLDGAFRALQKFLYTKPYNNGLQTEGHYQDTLFIIFTLLGCKVDMEVHSSEGSIDLVLYRPGCIYVMELKLDRSPREALKQIDEKSYARRFSDRPERIVKVGINFSTKKRNLTGWVIADEA